MESQIEAFRSLLWAILGRSSECPSVGGNFDSLSRSRLDAALDNMVVLGTAARSLAFRTLEHISQMGSLGVQVKLSVAGWRSGMLTRSSVPHERPTCAASASLIIEFARACHIDGLEQPSQAKNAIIIPILRSLPRNPQGTGHSPTKPIDDSDWWTSVFVDCWNPDGVSGSDL